jgi:hypothetical protein
LAGNFHFMRELTYSQPNFTYNTPETPAISRRNELETTCLKTR